jgi:hypothetical protein
MSTLVVTTVAAARATANDWLISRLPDRFAAGVPGYDQSVQGWRIPVWLSYPQLEPFGPVGELVVDESTGDVLNHTPTAEMKERALSLYEQHRDEIEAPLP